jgi:hypothetical protein
MPTGKSGVASDDFKSERTSKCRDIGHVAIKRAHGVVVFHSTFAFRSQKQAYFASFTMHIMLRFVSNVKQA